MTGFLMDLQEKFRTQIVMMVMIRDDFIIKIHLTSQIATYPQSGDNHSSAALNKRAKA